MSFDKHIEYIAASLPSALAAAMFDIKTRRIPNELTGATMLLGVSIDLLAGGKRGALEATVAALLSGALFFLCYLVGGMGAGDVKLMAALSSVVGLSSVPTLLVLTALAGGVMALGLALIRHRLRETMHNVVVLTSHHVRHGAVHHPELNVTNQNTLRLPYAVAIAAGCVGSFVCGVKA